MKKQKTTSKIRSLLLAIILLISFCVYSYAEDLSKPYSPSRAEWLEMSIFKAIKTQTDPWERRIGFITWVEEKEQTICITITQANGQGLIEQKEIDQYIELVQKNVEGVINSYEWAKGLKIHIQFI